MDVVLGCGETVGRRDQHTRNCPQRYPHSWPGKNSPLLSDLVHPRGARRALMPVWSLLIDSCPPENVPTREEPLIHISCSKLRFKNFKISSRESRCREASGNHTNERCPPLRETWAIMSCGHWRAAQVANHKVPEMHSCVLIGHMYTCEARRATDDIVLTGFFVKSIGFLIYFC